MKYNIVFIDCLPEYEEVKKYIKEYYPNIKSHGILCGHDWDNEEVKKAVLSIFDMKDVYPESGIWWIEK